MQATPIIASVETPRSRWRRRLAAIRGVRAGWIAWALLAAAAVFRLGILEEFRFENPFAVFPILDAELYWQRAGEMAAGRWIDGDPFHIAPLYTVLLGLLRTLGGGTLALQLIQTGLHLATGALVFAATRSSFGGRAGLVALALFLAMLEPALFATRILATTLQMFLAALLWWDGSRLLAADAPGPGHAARVGLWIGLLTLAYPAALLLVPGWVAWLVAHGRKTGGGRRAAAGILAACAAIGLATAHNAVVAGEFIPVTSHAGITLAAGNGPHSIGIFTPLTETSNGVLAQPRESAAAYRKAKGRDGSWNEIDRFFRDRVVTWMRDNPADAAALFARKAYWFLTSRDYDNVTAFSLEREHGLQDASAWLPIETPWIMGAAIVGALLALRRPRRHAFELALATLPLLTCVLFMYSARYRAVAIPILCGLAGFAAVAWRDLRLPRAATVALILLPLPLVLANTATGFGSVGFMREKFSTVLSERHLMVGRMHRREGRFDDAERHFQRTAEIATGNSAPLRELASLYMLEGDLAAARRTSLAAVQRSPEDVAALHLLYNAQVQVEDHRSAIITLHVLEKLTPTDPGVQLALAWLYTACPDTTLHDGHRARFHSQAAARLTAAETAETLVAVALAEALNGGGEAASAAALRAAELARASGDEPALGEIEQLIAALESGRLITSRPRLFETD